MLGSLLLLKPRATTVVTISRWRIHLYGKYNENRNVMADINQTHTLILLKVAHTLVNDIIIYLAQHIDI